LTLFDERGDVVAAREALVRGSNDAAPNEPTRVLVMTSRTYNQ
jgi:hypothetical protein